MGRFNFKNMSQNKKQARKQQRIRSKPVSLPIVTSSISCSIEQKVIKACLKNSVWAYSILIRVPIISAKAIVTSTKSKLIHSRNCLISH